MVSKKSTIYLLEGDSWLLSCLEGKKNLVIKLEGPISLVRL